MNARKPTLTKPITPSTRAANTSGRRREKIATASVHKFRIITHNSNEPECAPHTADKR